MVKSTIVGQTDDVLAPYENVSRDGQQDVLFLALQRLARAVRAFAGCEGGEIAQDLDRDTRFLLTERWTDRSAWEASAPGPSNELLALVGAAAAATPTATSLKTTRLLKRRSVLNAQGIVPWNCSMLLLSRTFGLHMPAAVQEDLTA